MNIFQTVILAITEGITEFLPISSTGHMTIVASLLNVPLDEFTKTFEVVIQIGAVMAALTVSLRSFPRTKKAFASVFLSFLPSVFLGLIFYRMIKNHLLGNIAITIGALFAGGILMILFERYHQPKKTIPILKLSLFQSVMIGLFQTLSMIPGVSRSAATIIGAMIIGLSRKDAVLYSFALAIPTMFAASFLDLYSMQGKIDSGQSIQIIIGLILAYITAYVTVNYFLNYVRSKTLIPFGWYRLAVALILIPLI